MSTQADGISSNTSAGTADYTLTTTTALPAPTGPPPNTPSVTLNSTLTNGSPTVTLPSTTGVAVGYGVSGTGIPSGTTVSQINSASTQLTLSQNATTTGSESLMFSPAIAPPQIVALIQPNGNLTLTTGGVITPSQSATQGPLTILSGSSGFNTSGVYDYLATASGQQALGLSFYGQGLAKGGIVNFSLNVANQSSPPQLSVQPAGTGVTIALTPPTTPPPSTTTTVTDTAVPEPLSLLLWSTLAGAGLLRVRALRQSNQAAHDRP